MLVSAGPLHQAGAAENKDVIHGPADNLQRDTWGRQPLGQRRGEGDGSFVPTLHRGTRGRGGTFDCWFVHYWSVPQEML